MEKNLNLISTDTAKCVKCGACADVCPMGVIGISADGFPESKHCAYRLCINCGYCVDVCVFGALYHRVRKRSADSAAAMKAKRYEAPRKNETYVSDK